MKPTMMKSEVQSEEPVAMEDDSMTSSEPTMKKINKQRGNHQKTKLVTTETTTETPQKEKTLVLHLKQKQILSLMKLVKRIPVKNQKRI